MDAGAAGTALTKRWSGLQMGELNYLSGFGNEFESEALAGALPQGQFSPQRVPFGLYTEKFSNSAFTAPRVENRRTWFYRIRPSVKQGEFVPMDAGLLESGPITGAPTPPKPLRWDPPEIPSGDHDFVDGLITIAANGRVSEQIGMGAHIYTATKSMDHRYFVNADGEMLIVPQAGGLQVYTECGVLEVAPGEIAVIPRGMKFKIDLIDATARGYVCENYGAFLRLPERGPVGSDGFANDRDFFCPVAHFVDDDSECELVCKFQGALYRCVMGHCPLDVVAWIGDAVPYKYDLNRFNTMNTVSYDHADPSIFTVLRSPSDTLGVANVDLVIFPSRWVVAENTFRPPWYHRNVMSEFMGLIYGQYEARKEGFAPGGIGLHNSMVPHGPDLKVYEGGTGAQLEPVRVENSLSVMFETRFVLKVTRWALESSYLQQDYRENTWGGLERHFDPSAPR